MVPGTRALAFVARWFDPSTVSSVFEPLIADWQREWNDAGDSRRRGISIRWSLAFMGAVLASSPRTLILAPAPAGTIRRVLLRIVIFTGIVSMLQTLPVIAYIDRVTSRQLPWLVLSLVPQGMALGFPFAMLWVADGIRRHRIPTAAERLVAMRVGVCVTVMMVALMGWVMPEGNQAFREFVSSRFHPVAPVIRELTATQLITEAVKVGHPEAGIWVGERPRLARDELSQRAFFVALPVILLWLQWGATRRDRQRWYLPPAWVMTAFGAFGLFAALDIYPAAGVWTPTLVMLLWGFLRRRWPGGPKSALASAISF